MNKLANMASVSSPQNDQALDTYYFREINKDARNFTSLKKSVESVECWKDLFICSTKLEQASFLYVFDLKSSGVDALQSSVREMKFNDQRITAFNYAPESADRLLFLTLSDSTLLVFSAKDLSK